MASNYLIRPFDICRLFGHVWLYIRLIFSILSGCVVSIFPLQRRDSNTRRERVPRDVGEKMLENSNRFRRSLHLFA